MLVTIIVDARWYSKVGEPMSEAGDEPVAPAAEDDDEIATQAEAFLVAWFGARQLVMEENFRRTNEQSLSTTQFILLRFMQEADAAHESRTISALAALSNLDPATVVRTVDSLEQRGIVARRRDTHDRRQVFVELTPDGRTTLHSSHQRFTARLTAIFRSMSAEGRVALLQGLTEFVTLGLRVEDGAGHGHEPASDHAETQPGPQPPQRSHTSRT